MPSNPFSYKTLLTYSDNQQKEDYFVGYAVRGGTPKLLPINNCNNCNNKT